LAEIYLAAVRRGQAAPSVPVDYAVKSLVEFAEKLATLANSLR
jgi:hypothetical protein